MPVLIDLTGKQYGRLTVIGRVTVLPRKDGVWWSCQCECGQSVDVHGQRLRIGQTQSCGCLYESRENHKKAPGHAARTVKLCDYKHGAKRRGLEWSLTDEEVYSLFGGDCHYCGAPPSMVKNIKRLNGSFVWNGIDRLDNKCGYTTKNAVSCCYDCNQAKKDKPLAEFESWLDRIASFRNPSKGMVLSWQ
jgi:5-methylcytosine-specific restriction endonuclease McrA